MRKEMLSFLQLNDFCTCKFQTNATCLTVAGISNSIGNYHFIFVEVIRYRTFSINEFLASLVQLKNLLALLGVINVTFWLFLLWRSELDLSSSIFQH